MTGRERPGDAAHVVLVGCMGAGKTSVGAALAARLGRRFVDTDTLVEEATGRSIAEIFAADGEERFRAHERDAILAAVDGSPAVIASGGGAVLDPLNRELLRGRGTVMWLRAPSAVLARRVGAPGDRPLLTGAQSVADRLAQVDGERRACYRETAHVVLDATRSLDDVVGQAAAALLVEGDRATRAVSVDDELHPYDVVVGSAARDALVERLAARRRAALVTQRSVREVATQLRDAVGARGCGCEIFEIDDGESTKSLATVEQLAGAWASWGLLRGDAVVAVGGGVVGDVAGFAAASYHRGVDVAQVPTTLLAMVDAAIGGKTAVNLAQGKNLLGAFHMPIGVYADPSVLASLPDDEYRSGLGEVAKYALLGDDELGRLVLERADELASRDPEVLAAVVARCAATKAAVVAADPFEQTGRRATLNLGHTLAHALETVGRYDMRHGEAVAVGLVFAAELAGALERLAPDEVRRQRQLIVRLDLPVAAPPGLHADELRAVMQRDKKAAGGLTFVLGGPDGVTRVDDPDARALDHAFAAIGVTT